MCKLFQIPESPIQAQYLVEDTDNADPDAIGFVDENFQFLGHISSAEGKILKPLLRWMTMEVIERKTDENTKMVSISIFLNEDSDHLIGLIFFHLKLIPNITVVNNFHEICIAHQIQKFNQDDINVIKKLAMKYLARPISIPSSEWKSYDPYCNCEEKKKKFDELGPHGFYELLTIYAIARDCAMEQLTKKDIHLLNSPVDSSEQARAVVYHIIGAGLHSFKASEQCKDSCNMMISTVVTKTAPSYFNFLRSRGNLM